MFLFYEFTKPDWESDKNTRLANYFVALINEIKQEYEI